MTDTLKRIKNPREKGGNLKGEKEHGKISQPKKELKIKACLTNKSDLWKTPKKMYKYFIESLKCFDPCPTNPKFNGLEIEWEHLNFVNPPYSQITKWIDKAIIKEKKGNLSILLLPARTDTQWFKKIIDNNYEIVFLEGRIHFDDKGSAPFPSMFVHTFRNKIKPEPTFKYLEKIYWDQLEYQ